MTHWFGLSLILVVLFAWKNDCLNYEHWPFDSKNLHSFSIVAKIPLGSCVFVVCIHKAARSVLLMSVRFRIAEET